MFKAAYGDLRNPIFISGMQALAAARDLPVGTAYNVAKIVELLEKEMQLINKLYVDLIDQFLCKGADGKWIPSEPGAAPPGSFKVLDGKSEALDEALKKFHDESIQIDRPQLDFKAVARHLAPREITALAALFLPFDEAKLA